MLREHKLQMQFNVFDNSAEGRVLSYLRDRERLTATSAREKVLQALSAWLAIDELEAIRSQLTEDEFLHQLGTTIALLEGRLAYCQSILRHQTGFQHSADSVNRAQVDQVHQSQVRSSKAVKDSTTSDLTEANSSGEEAVGSANVQAPSTFEGLEIEDDESEELEEAQVGILPFNDNSPLSSFFV